MKTLLPFLLMALLAAGCGDGGKELEQQISRGKALLAEGKHEAAAVELAKAVEQDKNSLNAWLNLGHAYYGLKKHDEALSAYVAAKRVDRHSIAPHIAHAKVQMDLGRAELAITELNFVVEMDPKNIEGLVLLARASQMPHKQPDGTVGVARPDLERAEMNLEAAATLAPQDAGIKSELAKVREKLGK